jgi:hypothetical protein
MTAVHRRLRQLHLRGVEQRQRFALTFFRQRRQLGAVRFCRRSISFSGAVTGAPYRIFINRV